MPAKINFSGVFHNALPVAYIRKVSLLEGELTEERISIKDRPQPIVAEKNIFGRKKLKSGVKDRKSRSTPSNRGLTINVDLVMKEGSSPDNSTVWYGDEEAQKYLKIKVMLCRNKKVAENILRGNMRKKMINKSIINGDIIVQIIDLNNLYDTPLYNHRKESIGGFETYSIPYSASFHVDEYRPSYLAVFASTILETGASSVQKNALSAKSRSIIQGIISSEILIENGRIKPLAYLLTTSDREIWAGPVHQHKKKGYMAGAFHTSEDHPLLKRREFPNIIVSDHRLLATAEKAELQLFPAQTEELEIKGKSGSRKRPKTSVQNKKVRKEAYVSGLFDSSNPSNVRNFVFHLNFDKLFRLEGQYGKIFEIVDQKARGRIIRKSRITNIRVFRHRVLRGIRKGTAMDAPFEERTEMIAMSDQPAGGPLSTATIKSHPDATTTEADPKSIGAIKEIFTTAGQGVRTFSVSDYDMSRRTDGLYQYSVNIEMEDGTAVFAQEQLDKLVKARVNLRQYYNLSKEYSNYDPVSDRATVKFEEEMKEAYPVPNRKEVMTGRSVDRLKVIKHGISSAPWIRSPAVYVDVLFNLTDINPMNADAIASLLYEISNPYCGNPTGTLTVLRMMESLEGKIKKVLGQKSIMMDELDYHRAPGSSIRGSAMANSKASRASLAVSHRFKKIFDSDILNDVGYDFLGGARKKGIGVRQLSIEQFKTRALLENQKYFKSEAASGAGEGEKSSRLVSSRLSYLSPAIVSTGRGESYNMLRNPFHFDQKRAAVAAILSLKPDAAGAGKDKLNPNTGFGSSYDASRMRGITKEEMKENIMNSLSLAKLGVTFMDPDEFDKRHSFEAEKNQNSKRRSRKVEISTSLGALSKASTDKIEVEDNMTTRGRTNTILERDDLSSVASEILSNFSRSDKELFSDPKIKTIDAFDLNNNQHNIVSRFLNVRKDKTLKDVMKKMPNQIRSLFLSDTPITNKHWIKHKEETGVDIFKSSIHSAMIYFNYEMLNRIEVFKGFKKSRTTGEMMLREPRFVLITEEDLISAREKGHTLICRMRPYHNAMLGFGHKPRLSLPVFDEHFLISPLKSRADDESLPSSVSPYIDRISDPARLNKTGTSALQRIVETSMLENVVMSEYLATVTVQQTNDVTKFGTKFGGKLAAQSTAPAIGSNPRDVLRSLSDGSPAPSAASDQRASTEEFVGRKKGTGMGGDY